MRSLTLLQVSPVPISPLFSDHFAILGNGTTTKIKKFLGVIRSNGITIITRNRRVECSGVETVVELVRVSLIGEYSR